MTARPAQTILRRLLALSWPVIGLNVLNVLALGVDTAMVGRLPNAEPALTGLGFAIQLVFLLMVAMMGVTVGTVATVSRAHGAADGERVNHVLLQSSQLTVLLGLCVAIVGNLAATTLLGWLGARGDDLVEAERYLRPLLWGATFNYLNILYAAVLRGVGNTRIAFVVALCSNALNVVLNYGLILGNLGLPSMGVRGAAIGTVCSQAFAVTLLVVAIRSKRMPALNLPLRPRALDLGLARHLFRVGAPASLDMVVLNAGFLSIIGMLGRLDAVAVAAHGIGLRVQALAFVPGMSVSQATAAMVGNALGAFDRDEALAVVRASLGLCLAIMTTLALIIVGLAEPIVRIFDIAPSSQLGELAILWMKLLGYGMPAVGLHIAFVGMFQGAGATKTSLMINVVATLAIQIPLSALLGFSAGWGVFGVWVAFPLSFVVKAAIGWVLYRRGRWARVGVSV